MGPPTRPLAGRPRAGDAGGEIGAGGGGRTRGERRGWGEGGGKSSCGHHRRCRERASRYDQPPRRHPAPTPHTPVALRRLARPRRGGDGVEQAGEAGVEVVDPDRDHPIGPVRRARVTPASRNARNGNSGWFWAKSAGGLAGRLAFVEQTAARCRAGWARDSASRTAGKVDPGRGRDGAVPWPWPSYSPSRRKFKSC